MSKIKNFEDFVAEIKYWLIGPLLQSTGIDNHVVILLITIFAIGLFTTAFLGFVLSFPWIVFINLRRNWKDTLNSNKLLTILGIIITSFIYYNLFKYLGFLEKNNEYPYRYRL